LKIKIKKSHENAVIPKYAKPGDAGLDLTAISEELTKDGIIYNTGLQIEIPEGYVGLLFPRSSVANKDLFLVNSVGVIDSQYRGDIKVVFKPNQMHGPRRYKVGERIAQLLIIPYPQIEFEEVDKLEDTERGDGSFGSSGK